MATASQIKADIQLAATTVVTDAVLRKGMRLVGAVAVDLIRKRSLAGIDNRGRKMPKYKPSYQAYKSKAVRGKVKIRDRRTPFAAKSVDDQMSLSGRTLTDMYAKNPVVKQSGTEATGEITIDFRSDRSKNIVEWQAKKGRDIRGLAPANTAQGKRERVELARALKNATRIPQNRKIDISGA